MKTYLITGARGFIGSHLAALIASLGHKVVGIGHGTFAPQRLEKLGISQWINGDIDHANLQQMVRRSGEIEAVFHLAGGSHVGRSFENPAEDFSRTVVAGSQLLEWVRQNSPQTKIVIASSAAVYGAGHDGPIAEDAPLNPFSPYGAHKAMLEALSCSYNKNFGIRVAICRLFSVYGEGLEKQLIYDLCRKCTHNKDIIELGGTGTELRDWLHVSDVTRLLWLLQEKNHDSLKIINGGSGAGETVSEVAHRVIQAWGEPRTVRFDGQVRQGDPISLLADPSESQKLGFTPLIDNQTGFQRVVNWFKTQN